MFSTDTVQSPDLETFSTAELVEAIGGTYRLESALIAQRLAAVAALLHRRSAVERDDPGRAYATVDAVEQTCAEVSAALNISAAAAAYQVHYAETLNIRLRHIGALLARGAIDWRTVQVIISRTDLVTDENLIAQLDESLAAQIGGWQGWSRQRVINAVDKQVLTIDPDAARERRRRNDAERDIGITAMPGGMAELWGTVDAADATAFDSALSQLAKSVCRNDPRTLTQRRVDALRALTFSTGLACRCGSADCPARRDGPPVGGGQTRGGAQLIINVFAHASALAGEDDQPAYLDGYGVIDAEQLRELAATAARRLLDEAPQGAAAMRYHPSAALQRAVRCRDLTCRFPGCDRPAEFCDIDHTIPFNHANPAAGGLTVLGNLKSLCRQHHRLKTFLGGPTGWRDTQWPDGTVVWVSPTGKIYRTTPAGRELFGADPPRRARTRAQDRATRVARARDRNRQLRDANAAARQLQQARTDEIEARIFRNHMRDMLFLFKGGPSTSPFCTWVNGPREPEELPPDWRPPPPPPLPEDPPF